MDCLLNCTFYTKLIAKRDSAILTKFSAFLVKKIALFWPKMAKYFFVFCNFGVERKGRSRKILIGVNSGHFSSTFSENLKWFGQVRKKLFFWCLGMWHGDVNVWIRLISSQWWVSKIISGELDCVLNCTFYTKLIAKRDSAILTKFSAFLVKKIAFFGQKWQSTFFVFCNFGVERKREE